MRRIVLGLAGATAAALGIATAALADKEKIHYTAAGQAAARAAVISRADIGTSTGWTGGARKPEVNTGTGCPNFEPKQSDLVLIGAARTDWKHAGIEFDSEAQVLETPAMVKLDWQRTVLAPEVVPCFKDTLTKSLAANEKLISFKQIPFPKVGDYTRLYRALVDVTTTAGTTRVLVDELLMGRGTTEISVTTTSVAAPAAAVKGAEARLARLLTSRVVI